jgi:3-isopropylmalate dehydrogenase
MGAADPRQLSLAVIPGDGIGPELVGSAREVLEAVTRLEGITLDVVEEPGGAGTYRETGQALSAEALDRLRSADAVLKGPVGLPDVRRPDGTEAGLLGGVMRGGLDTYANVRPVRLLPGVQGPTRHRPEDVDYVIVRENTEGLYLSRGAGVVTRDAATDQLMITRNGSLRVVRFAFELALDRAARSDTTPRVACVDKSNVLRSFALFRSVFEEVAATYPQVECDYLYADAAAHELVAHPHRFDVLVMENFLGDILSDLGAATAGGLGMCGSGNIGDDYAYFEPIHGSAPTIAGQDKANPVSQVLSAAMMLAHVGLLDAAHRVERAVEQAFASGAIVIDPSGSPERGTRAATAAVLAHL